VKCESPVAYKQLVFVILMNLLPVRDSTTIINKIYWKAFILLYNTGYKQLIISIEVIMSSRRSSVSVNLGSTGSRDGTHYQSLGITTDIIIDDNTSLTAQIEPVYTDLDYGSENIPLPPVLENIPLPPVLATSTPPTQQAPSTSNAKLLGRFLSVPDVREPDSVFEVCNCNVKTPGTCLPDLTFTNCPVCGSPPRDYSVQEQANFGTWEVLDVLCEMSCQRCKKVRESADVSWKVKFGIYLFVSYLTFIINRKVKECK